MPGIRIGVDATCWSNGRGYGRHARALLSALVNLDQANRYTFFVDTDLSQGAAALPAGVKVHNIRSTTPTVMAASAQGRRSLRDMWRMSRALSQSDMDVLLFPTIYSYVPVWSRAKKVVMIHDVIAEKFPHLTVPARGAQLAWRAKVALGRWQADALATVSEYSRSQIISHFGIPPHRVSVVGEASDPVFRVLEKPRLTPALVGAGLSSEGRAIVYVGGFGPHKNLSALIRAFAEITSQRSFADVRLYLVGDHTTEAFHTEIGSLREKVDTLAIGDRVVFTGFLPDEELVVLLNLATVLVLPSLMEGFGLPAVEAAACGCPVIATSASPLPELLGSAAEYVNPNRPDQLAGALGRVLGSPEMRRRMRESGVRAASQLTWHAAALQMRDLIEGVKAA